MFVGFVEGIRDSSEEEHALSLPNPKLPESETRFVELVDNVKDSGGKAHILSTMHVSGEQLMKLTGIAAILRFPVYDIDEQVLTLNTLSPEAWYMDHGHRDDSCSISCA
jgi:hypothetical protein